MDFNLLDNPEKCEDSDEFDSDEEKENYPYPYNEMRKRYGSMNDTCENVTRLYMMNRIRDEIRIGLHKPLGDKLTKFPTIFDDYPSNDMYIWYGGNEFDKYGVPVNNLDQIAYHGTYRFGQKYDPDWDVTTDNGKDKNGIPGKDYMSEPITDPTWLEVMVMANTAILITHDQCHVSFSDAVEDKYDKNILWFSMDS